MARNREHDDGYGGEKPDFGSGQMELRLNDGGDHRGTARMVSRRFAPQAHNAERHPGSDLAAIFCPHDPRITQRPIEGPAILAPSGAEYPIWPRLPHIYR